MAISSSLYSGISGLSTMGDAMAVIGNNISNVNTVAFKSSRSTFQDVLAQQISTAAGTSQVGRGVTLSSIAGLFAQGSFESTSQPTDLAIGGNGFFIVRAPGTEENYFTRAGEFRFDEEGYLVNPAGYVGQGWQIDSDTGQTTGTMGDVTVSKSSAPVATDAVTIIAQVDARETSNSVLYTGVLATSSWTGSDDTPIASNEYQYHTSIKIYDTLGNSHDLTIYFDPTATDNQWEYLVTCDPDEDTRTGVDPAADFWAGALLYGTVTFSTAGNITDINASTIEPADGSLTALVEGAAGTPNGYFQFTANFTGTDQEMDLNFGSAYNTSSAAWEREAMSTSQYASSSTTIFSDQNGFGAGFLQSVSVNIEGRITGHYSNGQILERALIGLADFSNLIGLSKSGGNLFAETTDSGAPVTGAPGTNGLGTIAPNSLEQSNVDLGSEFVRMITIQRGFQANSRIITTTDDMLAELINLKR